MRVIVRTTVGLAVPTELECQPEDAVGTLKNKAATSQRIINPEGVSLNYEGKLMDKSKRNKKYDVKEGSTLELVPHYRRAGTAPLPFFLDTSHLMWIAT